MPHSRRSFLRTAAATAAGLVLPAAAFAGTPVDLVARTGTADLGLPDGKQTPIWGYGGRAPGPVLRVRQGERIARRFVNELPQASTIHWHGIRIANAMDGVPELTQDAVPAGGDFLYDFVAPDAGTYWYHPHNRTWEQLARGLYGALIVEEPDPPDVDRDEVLLIDDWRIADDGTIHEPSLGAMHDWAHAGRLGNWVTVNGDGDYALDVRRRERLRLRLVNTANARIFDLGFKGLAGWVVALDGQPLEAPLELADIALGPAQRADVIADVTADGPDHEGEAFLYAMAGDERLAIATFRVGDAIRAERLPAPPPLRPNPVPPLGSLAGVEPVTMRMEGGAMGGMTEALYKGRRMAIQDLVGEGKVWAFNGIVDLPDEPLFAARPGETVRIRMINDTSWPHAMHTHGHHFRRVGAAGELGPWRDTLVVERGETADIAFVADNPGKWLFHCHMVEHTAAGMATWFVVG
ncbi:MAG: multicopper oxidase family protein [Rhodospirillales bacterium]